MPRRKKSKQEEREEKKKKRLASIANISEGQLLEDAEDITMEEIKSASEAFNSELSNSKKHLKTDEMIFVKEKNALQKEIASLANPTILEVPEFLTNPEMEEERKAVFDKIRYLLKRRFSLITIADILETNDYARLDEIIIRKDDTYRAVERYSDEEGTPIRIFSGFKKTVGDEYSRTYSEQEDRMKAAINILYKGTYFKGAEQEGENVELYIEDIVASIIDNPEFNLACQIESEFVVREMLKASDFLGQLRSKQELEQLIEELRTTARTLEDRTNAYRLMDELMTGKSRTIIEDQDGQQIPPNSEKGER